ncbi:hypothetical protein OIU80_09480 [Flavobacterium sp. LS1R47]|uniref:Uncharacterized protein n=1 Tax=Flavobacterium frigoritolerans TaxID=2987686 RepID=A0A9X2ZR86_9FLAO|nr:hypothetical protein [Flavobacterium frigoritolerans]MCV9932513.1 hypothetical protein [Flavobacterium frigoritolerans]
MEYPIKIPKSNPHYEQLEKAITDLLLFIEAGAVYVSCNGNNNVIVTFILKENCTQEGDALGETAFKFIKLYPDFVFKFINSKWADYGFRKGKLFFIQHCTYKELVYFEPNSKVFYPRVNTSKHLSKKAKRRFDIDIESAVVVFRNVSIYRRSNKSVDAAFAMHQTLRYIYICASEFLMPEFISSTCLLIHYDYIIDFAPTFKTILNKDIQEDKEILIMLNTAYNSIQQNLDMGAIDFTLIDIAKAKIELMQREINRLFHEYIKLCKQKVKELNNQDFLGKSIFNNRIQSNYIMDDAFLRISDVITDSFKKIRAIHCFGYTTIHEDNTDKSANYSNQLPNYHFYLLVLNLEHIENGVASVEALIREKFEGKYKVTILNHSINHLRKKNCNQKYFFNAIISNGLLIYNNSLFLVYSKTFELEREIDFVKKIYDSKMVLAQQFLSLGQNCFNDDTVAMKNDFLYKAMKQIAIGHIHLFLGYHTGKFSWSCLFSLLKYIQEIEFPFDFVDEKDNPIYQLRAVNTKKLKQKNTQSTVVTCSELLEDECIIFFEQAKKIAEIEFKRLENESKQYS